MSSSNTTSKRDGCLFSKKVKKFNIHINPFNDVSRDYKILLALCMIFGFPVAPSQLQRFDDKEHYHLLTFIVTVFNVCRTLICLFCASYSHRMFTMTSLAITFNTYNVCALIGSWCLILKRNELLHAFQMLISVLIQVSSRKFKSKFNLTYFIMFFIFGVSTISSTALLISVQVNEISNITQFSFLWMDIDKEFTGLFFTIVNFSCSVTYSFSAVMTGIVCLISATCYFHLGDVIINYGIKLKKSFEYGNFTARSIAENLMMFQNIIHLSAAIDKALASSVMFLYGAAISCFFNAVSALIHILESGVATIILTASLFAFALSVFFIVTLTGNRVRRKHRELQECAVDCSRLVIQDSHDVKRLMHFSLILQDIHAIELRVTGNMFVIGNSLVLSVAGVLITYGVIIFQMDD